MRRGLAAACSVLLALVGGAGAAEAGPPGRWTQVTGRDRPDPEPMQVGLARSADGALHVLHVRSQGREAVLHTALSRDARRLSRPTTVASFIGGVNYSVALVAGPGGLRGFFAGLEWGSPLDRVMSTSTSANGRSWTPPQPSNAAPNPYRANGIGAGLGLDGTPFSVWGSPGPGWHEGVDPAAPDGGFRRDDVFDPGVGVDSATGQVVVAWNRFAAGGTAVQSIAPAAGGIVIPNSGAAQTLHRVGVTGRLGGAGVFVAYTAGTNQFSGRAAVWRLGDRRGRPVSAPGARHASIAAAPEGRLWLFWDRDDRIYARRSNRAATVFGRAVSIAEPRRTSAILDLAGEGSRGPLDVLALVEHAGGGCSTWHQRIRPGIDLRVRAGRGAVRVTVTDAGEPLPGTVVSVGRSSAGRTNRRGAVRLELPPGRYRVTARKRGYSPVSTRVRVG